MNTHHPIRHVALVTLQLTGPLSIGSGAADGIEDMPMTRDANDLPTIPGSSIAGVLRAATLAEHGADSANALFGYVQGDQGARSQVHVSWGHIHDADNRIREGLQPRNTLLGDALLAPLLDAKPAQRPHARLTHRGAALDTALFNRSYVPAGYRFSFRLQLEGDGENDTPWHRLLNLLASPGFRLGGASRRGYGSVAIADLRARRFDLRQNADLNDYLHLGAGLDIAHADVLPVTEQPQANAEHWLHMPLHLDPVTAWRIGGGNKPLGEGGNSDANPYVETVVDWRTGKGRLRDVVTVPGSAVRGALAHRVAYHYQCHTGAFIDPDAETVPGADWNPRDQFTALRGLLGHVGEAQSPTADADAIDASRSRWIIDDARIPVDEINNNNLWTLPHVSIDRFTGGARDSLLFSEQLIVGKAIDTRIAIDTSRPVDKHVRAALHDALGDLAAGRLALGAATAHGNGVFAATLDTSHPLMQWLTEGETST